nr:type II secretion system F family protein [Streptomyces xiamenensis]
MGHGHHPLGGEGGDPMTGTLRAALPLLAAVAAPLMLLRVLAARRTRAARLAALWKEPGTELWRDRLRWPGVGTRRPRREDPQLPLLAELLAACLAAGAAPGAAAGAVGGSLSGPLAAGLRRAATELRLGGEPAAVWKRFGQLPGASGLARRLELADVSGAPAVATVAAEAAECRARRGRAAQTTARRAAVLVTGPLGLCFLPAFLLIGVAPVVIGLAKELM